MAEASVPQGDTSGLVARRQTGAVGGEGQGADLVALDQTASGDGAGGQAGGVVVTDEQSAVGTDGQEVAGQAREHGGPVVVHGVPHSLLSSPRGSGGGAGRVEAAAARLRRDGDHRRVGAGGRQVQRGLRTASGHVPDRAERAPPWERRISRLVSETALVTRVSALCRFLCGTVLIGVDRWACDLSCRGPPKSAVHRSRMRRCRRRGPAGLDAGCRSGTRADKPPGV